MVHAAKALLLLMNSSRFLGWFSRSCFRGTTPVVQVMGDTVAIRTFRELTHHSCRVRNAVAILAFWHHLVLLLVTGYTEERFMLGFAGTEQAECFTVTGSTLLGR